MIYSREKGRHSPSLTRSESSEESNASRSLRHAAKRICECRLRDSHAFPKDTFINPFVHRDLFLIETKYNQLFIEYFPFGCKNTRFTIRSLLTENIKF